MKTWERHYFFETARLLALLLGCFFFVYFLIDYAFNAKTFLKSAPSIGKIALYYVCRLSEYLAILVPFCTMIATMKVLLGANQHRELVALRAGGISPRAILRPFIMLAAAATLLLYANTEWLQPKAMHHIQKMAERVFHRGGEGKRALHVLELSDGSHLVYQRYLPEKRAFFDVVWLRSADELWKIKYLLPQNDPPEGRYADLLMRNPSGEMVLQKSWTARAFPEIGLSQGIVQSALLAPQEQSLSQLWTNLRSHHAQKEIGGALGSFLCYRSALPLLSLLAVLLAAPLCLRFDRNFPLFLLYAFSITGFVVFLVLVNSALILAQGGVFPPLLAIGLPFALALGTGGALFARKTTA